MKGKMNRRGRRAQTKHSSPSDGSETQLIESHLIGGNSEQNDGRNTLPYGSTLVLENTVPLENTLVLENTQMLENTVPLEDTVLLETQLLGEEKNKEEKGLLLEESDRDNETEDTVNVDNLEGYTEAKTQLLEDFQEDNAIHSSRDKKDLDVIVDSDDEGGGNTELLSEDEDASDGRSSPRRVDELKGNQFVETFPSPDFLHGKETSQINSTDIGKRSSFNSIDSSRQHEQQNVVDSDASTEDESDVGEPLKSGDFNLNNPVHAISDNQRSTQGVLPHTSRRAPSMTNLSQEASKVNNQLENIRVVYQNPDPKSTKDGHKLKQDLNSDGLNSPRAFQSVGTGRKIERGVTPISITRTSVGDSSDLSLTPTSGPRSIASVRVASLRASGLRASRMLSTTKEVTSATDAKNDAVGKHDSSRIPQFVPAAGDKTGHQPWDKPSYKPQKGTGPNEADDLKQTANVRNEGRSDIVQSAKLRAENLTARKLFYTEAMEVDKSKPSNGLDEDDEGRYRDSKEEGDEPRALGINEQNEERAIGGNGESLKLVAQVGDKEDDEPSAQVKNDKVGIPKEQENSNIVNMNKLNSTGLYDLGFNKKSHNRPIYSGLNYLDSQEPGEQSQADAMNIVDKLVWLNTNGLSQESEPEKLTEMTCYRPLSARGTQNLAHLVECKSPKEKIGVFDWVDSQHDEGGCQFFRKNGLAVPSSGTEEDKVKTESKQINRRSYKGKKDASVPKSKDVKIGKDKSKLLSQSLLNLANSGGLDSNMTIPSDVLHEREIEVATKVQGAKATLSKGVSKSESAKVSRRSGRLQLDEAQDLPRNQNIASDKQNDRGEKLPLNLGDVSEQIEKGPICRESSSMSDIANDTELAAEAMQSMPSEISPNQATEEITHPVEQKGLTKSGESRKRKTKLSGVFRKGTLPSTDSENGETFAKQVKASSSLAAQGKSRRVHWAEDEGQVQQKGESRKQGILRISKQDGKEKVESKGSEVNEENQDMLQNLTKVVRRKRGGANVEVTSKPAGELQSARVGTGVGCFTRRMSYMNPVEMHGTKISSGSSEAKNDEERDVEKGSLSACKKKRTLGIDHLSKPSGVRQPAWAALEGMQSKAGASARHSARQRNQKQMERQTLEAQRDSKSSSTNEEAQDLLKSKNAGKIVGRKRKKEDVEDISHKASNSRSTDQSSKSKVPGEVDSNGADGEGTFMKAGEVAIQSTRQTKNLLDKQNDSKKPANQDESSDKLRGTEKAVRSKRSQKNKDENHCKPSKPISAGEDLPAGAGEEEVAHEKVHEAAVRMTRQAMCNLGAGVDSAVCASTDIERDNSFLKHTVTESRSQRRKAGRRKSTSATPNRDQLTDGGSLVSPSKDEVQVNGTSADVGSPCTFQIPSHVMDVRSPASTGHGPEMADSSKKGLRKKGTPKSTLKRELGRLDASETGQLSILKDSTRKKREPGSVRVLFSHGLDDDLVKQQQKILTKLGGQATTSPADCTHFVTDKFIRTRNMLEAMAAGKPVVTYLWLENSRQASYFIDEKKYILEDAKKEKEIGFSMSASLASAQQKPLLQNKRLFITSNTKPERDSIVSLVKAANGQVLNSLKGAFSKKDENMENLIAISCEEDYEVCIPLLEKGVRVYSPEFLLNGIVVQSLDFSRDQLFTDHVKRMHSRQRS